MTVSQNMRSAVASRMFRCVAALGVLLTGGIICLAQQPGRADRSATTGRVERFTTAPKGEVDGAVLDDGTTIHWPPHEGTRVSRLIARGDRVRVEGEDETGPDGDQHFEVTRLENLRSGESVEVNSAPPRPRPGERGPRGRAARDRDEMRTVEGTVSSITTAPRGEVDGLVLDDGTIVHWPPHLQEQFAALAVKGERVRAVGRMKRAPEGENRLEVETLTKLTGSASDSRLRDLEERIGRIEEQLSRLSRGR